MAQKTYDVEALLAILSDHAIAAHEETYTWHVDSPGEVAGAEPLVRYLIGDDGVWLSFEDGLTEHEVKTLTGYATTELRKRGLTRSGRCIWELKDGSPLLPLPFTLAQLQHFEERTSGMCSERIWCGEETDDLIASLAAHSPDAAEIARALVFGQLPAGSKSLRGSAKKWTPERLAELQAYRDKHGSSKAAAHFNISTNRLRALLPRKKPSPAGYSAFSQNLK